MQLSVLRWMMSKRVGEVHIFAGRWVRRPGPVHVPDWARNLTKVNLEALEKGTHPRNHLPWARYSVEELNQQAKAGDRPSPDGGSHHGPKGPHQSLQHAPTGHRWSHSGVRLRFRSWRSRTSMLSQRCTWDAPDVSDISPSRARGWPWSPTQHRTPRPPSPSPRTRGHSVGQGGGRPPGN